jgi:AraC-like DNA-binding protein
LQFVFRFGQTFHDQFHDSRTCRFAPSAVAERVWLDDAASGAGLLERWADRFFAEFNRVHPLSAGERAARLIQQQYREPCHVRDMATELCVKATHLARSFRRHLGMSPKEYQQMLRIAEAVEQLHAGKVEAVALQVGFKSRKDFNRGFARLTGLTPAQFKRLPVERAKDVV